MRQRTRLSACYLHDESIKIDPGYVTNIAINLLVMVLILRQAVVLGLS